MTTEKKIPVTATIEFTCIAGEQCSCTRCKKTIKIGQKVKRKGYEILCSRCGK